MIQRVTNDVVLVEKFLLEIFRQFVERRAAIGIFCVAPGAFRWQLMCPKEAISCSAGIERAIDVEE